MNRCDWPGARAEICGVKRAGVKVMVVDAESAGLPVTVALNTTICAVPMRVGAVYTPPGDTTPTAGVTDQLTDWLPRFAVNWRD